MIFDEALEIAEEKYPGATKSHRNAFARAVGHSCRENPKGFGFSVREQLYLRALSLESPSFLGDWTLEKAIAFCEPLFFGPALDYAGPLAALLDRNIWFDSFKDFDALICVRGILWGVTELSPALPGIDLDYGIVPHQHITLVYDCNVWDAAGWVDQYFDCVITEIAQSKGIQAARVEIPKGLIFAGEIPHLTLSHRPGIAPASAVRAVKERDLFYPVKIRLRCLIEFQPFPFQKKIAPHFCGAPRSNDEART